MGGIIFYNILRRKSRIPPYRAQLGGRRNILIKCPPPIARSDSKFWTPYGTGPALDVGGGRFGIRMRWISVKNDVKM